MNWTKPCGVAVMAFLFLTTPGAAAATDPALIGEAKRAADSGLRYLRTHQGEDGSWSGSVGITALALRAFLENRRGYTEEDGPFITRPIQFLLAHVKDDGSISETIYNRNYNTAVAITALEATGNPQYDEVIRGGQQFLQGLQLGPKDGYEADHKYYGGIGYGGDERPDLSNQYMAIEALKATGLAEDDPLWDRAVTFISRCQNNSETNDIQGMGNDGGFTYMPLYSPHGDAGSYGGMTHAGLLALLYAGVERDDPRVQAAYGWIQGNYTLEDNPGAKGKQGLFYYYNAFSKTMRAWGEPELVDDRGVAHDWRADLINRLMALQKADGSWVNDESGRWWEDRKDLVTAWTVIALNNAINP